MEGLVRDIVRLVQSMRKNAGFAVEDRIEISWDFDGHILEALGKFNEYFCAETLTEIIKINIEKGDYMEEIELKGKKYLITLKRFRIGIELWLQKNIQKETGIFQKTYRSEVKKSNR